MVSIPLIIDPLWYCALFLSQLFLFRREFAQTGHGDACWRLVYTQANSDMSTGMSDEGEKPDGRRNQCTGSAYRQPERERI